MPRTEGAVLLAAWHWSWRSKKSSPPLRICECAPLLIIDVCRPQCCAGTLTPADSTTLESLQIEIGNPSASEGSATGSLLSPGAKRRKVGFSAASEIGTRIVKALISTDEPLLMQSERVKPATKSDQRKDVLKKALRLQGAE